jgi:hypothetical protein
VDVTDSIITYIGAPTRAPDCEGSSQSCMIQERVGEEIAVGEVTGDGAPDLVVAAPAGWGVPAIEYTAFPMGHVYVLSPRL